MLSAIDGLLTVGSITDIILIGCLPDGLRVVGLMFVGFGVMGRKKTAAVSVAKPNKRLPYEQLLMRRQP